MSMDNFKSPVSLSSLPIQLLGGIGAWEQHYLSYKRLEIIVVSVYLTLTAGIADPITPSLNKSTHTIIALSM